MTSIGHELPIEGATAEKPPALLLGRKFDYDFDVHNELSTRIQEIFKAHHIGTTPHDFVTYELAANSLVERAEDAGPTELFKDTSLTDFIDHYANFGGPTSTNVWYRFIAGCHTHAVSETQEGARHTSLTAADIKAGLEVALHPDTAKAAARSVLNSDYYPGSGGIAMIYIGTLLSGKNSFKNEVIQKIKRILDDFLSDEPKLGAAVARIGAVLEPSAISTLPSVVYKEKKFSPLLYENAKQALPSYNGLLLLQDTLAKLDMTNGRAAVVETVNYLLQSEVLDTVSADVPASDSVDETLEKFKPMELDWAILPQGDLEASARDLVSSIKQNRPTSEVSIDLERLKSLEEIRQGWGPDRSYYVRGAFKRRVVRKDGKECPDEYIVLVLQDFDEDNNLQAEHAVAESPIVGPHAMYVYRQDAGEGFSWRDVMAMPKSDAKLFNARAVKHNKTGLPVQEKALHLLRVSKDEFISNKNYRLKGFTLPRDLVEIQP